MGNTTDMTVGSPTQGILRFALPLILGYILQQMYLVIDAAIVGRWVGVEALAAIGASSSITFLIMGFCNGSCAGFAIPVAQTFGAHDYSKMRAYVAHSLRIGAVIGVILTMLTAVFCARILRVVNTPDDIFHDAYIFLLLTFLTIPFTIAYNLLSGFIRALGNSRQPFYFLIVSSMVNIVLDVILILGMGMGVEGAGIATMLSQALAAVLCWVYIHRTLKMLIPHGDEWTYHDSMTGHLLNSGIPMGLQFSITGIGIIMLQSANNALGTTYVAAFTASMRIKYLFTCVYENIGVAMATYCGQNVGARQIGRIARGVRSAMAIHGGLYRLHPGGHLPLCRPAYDALRRQWAERDSGSGCPVYANQQLLLRHRRTALHLPLLHPGHGLQQSEHAERRDGDDCAQRSEPVACASLPLHRSVLRRPHRMARRRALPYPRLPVGLPPTQPHHSAPRRHVAHGAGECTGDSAAGP